MKNIRSLFCLFAIILVASCGPQAAPTQSLQNTDSPQPTITITPAPSLTPAAPTSTRLPLVFPTAVVKDCSQGWTHLKIDALARVAGSENDPANRVRSKPEKGGNIIIEIPPGTIVKVTEGPVCADGLVYWKVENSSIPGGVGWTAEGDGNAYWLELYAALPLPVSLSGQGVSLQVPRRWSTAAKAELVPADSDSWCKWPAHVRLTLNPWPAKSNWKPIIFTFMTGDMPDWYPICPGAPLLRARLRLLSHGDRLLFGSKNAQPIFNSELIYAYSGTSLDGKRTFFAFFPVNFPLLAYSFQDLALPTGGIPFNIESQDWDAYYPLVGEQLGSAADSDFTPSLELLDAIAESITVP